MNGHGHGQPPPGGWGHGAPPQHGGAPQYAAPPQGGQQLQPNAGLQIQADYIFLQWMLMMVNPVVTLMGREHSIKWGRPHLFPLPPGNHQIRVYYPWFFQQANSVTTWVQVHVGFITQVKYTTSFLTFASGNLTPFGHRPWG